MNLATHTVDRDSFGVDLQLVAAARHRDVSSRGEIARRRLRRTAIAGLIFAVSAHFAPDRGDDHSELLSLMGAILWLVTSTKQVVGARRV